MLTSKNHRYVHRDVHKMAAKALYNYKQCCGIFFEDMLICFYCPICFMLGGIHKRRHHSWGEGGVWQK